MSLVLVVSAAAGKMCVWYIGSGYICLLTPDWVQEGFNQKGAIGVY